MPEKNLQYLYDTVSQTHDVGDYETFAKKMQSEKNRRFFYDTFSENYDLGDFSAFENRLFPKMGLGEAVVERIKPTVGGRGAAVETILKTLALPANLLAAALPTRSGEMAGKEETYAEQVARGKFPAEALSPEELQGIGRAFRTATGQYQAALPEQEQALGALATDVIVDPLNLAGWGLGKKAMDVIRLAKAGKAANAAKTVAEVAEAAKTVNIDDFVASLGKSKEESALKKILNDIKEGVDPNEIVERAARENIDVTRLPDVKGKRTIFTPEELEKDLFRVNVEELPDITKEAPGGKARQRRVAGSKPQREAIKPEAEIEGGGGAKAETGGVVQAPQKIIAKIKSGEATGKDIKQFAQEQPKAVVDEAEATLRQEFKQAANDSPEQGNLSQGIDILTQASGKKPQVPIATAKGTAETGKNIKVYHGSRRDIKGELKPDKDGIFWVTKDKDWSKGYGTNTLEFEIPEAKILKEGDPVYKEILDAAPDQGYSKLQWLEEAEKRGYLAVERGNEIATRTSVIKGGEKEFWQMTQQEAINKYMEHPAFRKEPLESRRTYNIVNSHIQEIIDAIRGGKKVPKEVIDSLSDDILKAYPKIAEYAKSLSVPKGAPTGAQKVRTAIGRDPNLRLKDSEVESIYGAGTEESKKLIKQIGGGNKTLDDVSLQLQEAGTIPPAPGGYNSQHLINLISEDAPTIAQAERELAKKADEIYGPMAKEAPPIKERPVPPKPTSNAEKLMYDDLSVGDEFTINGEKFTVTAKMVDDETGRAWGIKLKDRKNYEQDWGDFETGVSFDAGSLKKAGEAAPAPKAEPLEQLAKPTAKEPWEMTKGEFYTSDEFAPNYYTALNFPRLEGDEIVTIYRGIKKGATRKIKPGDWVTMNKGLADDVAFFRRGKDWGEVIQENVKKSDLVKMDYDIGNELAYLPKGIEKIHKNAVEQALSEGKPVPDEVLKDYPDLVKKAEPTPIEQVAKQTTTGRNYPDTWDNQIKLGRKVEIVKQAGWTTNKGGLSRLGEKIAESKWEELSPAAKNVLQRKIDDFYSKPLKEGESIPLQRGTKEFTEEAAKEGRPLEKLTRQQKKEKFAEKLEKGKYEGDMFVEAQRAKQTSLLEPPKETPLEQLTKGGKTPVTFKGLQHVPGTDKAVPLVDLPNGSTVGLDEAAHYLSPAEKAKIDEAFKTSHFSGVVDQNEAIRLMEAGTDVVGQTAPKQAGLGISPDLKKRAANFLRKYFKSGGNLPKEVVREGEKLRGRIAVRMRDIDRHLNTLRQVAKETPELRTEAGLQKMDAYLKGDRSVNLPNHVKVNLDAMRDEIDNLSRELMRSGIPSEKLQLTIEDNLGQYITRSYRKFLEKGYKPTDEATQAARALFTHTIPSEMVGELPNLNYVGRRVKLSNAGFETVEDIARATPDELVYAINTKGYTTAKAADDIAEAQRLLGEIPNRIEGRIDELLAKDLDKANFRQGTPMGRVNLNNLKRRKDIDEAIRDLYGEVKDPYVNFYITAKKIIEQVENRKFLEGIARFNESLSVGDPQKFLYNKAFKQGDKSYSVKLSAEGNKALEPLDGLYTTPEIADEFKNFGEATKFNKLWQSVIAANTIAKYTKTVLSPITVVRNFYGNIGFAVANGHYRLPYMKEAMNLVRRNLGEKMFGADALRGEFKVLKDRFAAEGIINRKQLHEKALELGVIEDNVYSGELKALLSDMGQSIDKGKMASPRAMAKWARKGVESATEIYGAMDDTWKLYGWFNEIARGKGLDKAARIVRDTYPTYSKVPRFGKAMRHTPLLGTFISFPTEVLRVGKNIAKMAAKGDVPRILGGGLATAGTGAGYLAYNYSQGITEEEQAALREFVAPWEKNGQLFVTGVDGENFSFVNGSYTDPWSYASDPTRALYLGLRKGDVDGAFRSAFEEFFDPYLSEGLFVEKIIDIARNKKNESGAPVYNEEDSYEDKFYKSLRHVAETLVPPLTPGLGSQYQRLERALRKEITEYGQRDLLQQEALNTVVGMRKRTINKKEALKYSAMRIERRLQEANRIINEGLRETSTIEDLREKYTAMENSRKRIFDDFSAKIKAARTLGLSDEEIKAQLLKSTNISKKIIDSWMNGQYTPYQPEEEKMQKIKEKLGLRSGRIMKSPKRQKTRRTEKPKRGVTPLEQLIGAEQ